MWFIIIIALLISIYAITKVNEVINFLKQKEAFEPYLIFFSVNWDNVFKDFYGMEKKETVDFYKDFGSFRERKKNPILEKFLFGSTRLTVLDFNSTSKNFLYYWNDVNSFMTNWNFFEGDFGDLPKEKFDKYPFYKVGKSSMSTNQFGIYWGDNDFKSSDYSPAYRFFITTKESHKKGMESDTFGYNRNATKQNVCVIPQEFIDHPFYVEKIKDPGNFYRNLGWKYRYGESGNYSIENKYLTVEVHYL